MTRITPYILGLALIFFLPVTENYYDTNKWVLLVSWTCILLLTTGIKLLSNKQVRAPTVRTLLPFGLCTLVSFVYLYFSPNKIESLTYPAGVITFAVLLVFSAYQHNYTRILLVIGALLGFISLYQFLGVALVMFPTVQFLNNPLWTPTGTSFSTLAVFSVATFLGIVHVIKIIRKSHYQPLFGFEILALLFTGIGYGITLFQLLNVLPQRVGTDSLTLPILIVFSMLVAPYARSKPYTMKNWVRHTLAFILIIGSTVSIYFLGRFYLAELYFYQSLVSQQKKLGKPAYESLTRAIDTNPYMTDYHIRLSQLSLQLADSEASPSALTGQLVEQSIREAKIAVTLNAKSLPAWENLTRTYQVLMPIAKDADTWAIQSQKHVISMDPTNPDQYVLLGQLFVFQKNYEEAIDQFNKAISLDPKMPNAYYNLANAYKLTGNTGMARTTLSTVLQMVPVNSSDYVKAKNELNALE